MDVTLLNELREKHPIPPLRPDGFGITAEEYSESDQFSLSMARRDLTRMAKEGIVQAIHMRENGKTKVVYCRLGDWPPKKKK